jgi:hypothetical protein
MTAASGQPRDDSQNRTRLPGKAALISFCEARCMDARTLTPFLVIAGSLFGLAVVACNTQDGTLAKQGEPSSPTSTTSSASQLLAAAAGQTPIVGTWYGRATIDQNLVQRQLLALPSMQQQQQFRNMVESFVTTEMAARFLPTGEMQMEVQIRPVGQTAAKGASQGMWRSILQSADSMTIEYTEYHADGTRSVSQARYVFSADGKQAYLVPSVDPALAMCGAVIVFERVVEPGQLANQNDSSRVR